MFQLPMTVLFRRDHIGMALPDVPHNVRIIESGPGAYRLQHELDVICLLKRFASDYDLSQDMG